MSAPVSDQVDLGKVLEVTKPPEGRQSTSSPDVRLAQVRTTPTIQDVPRKLVQKLGRVDHELSSSRYQSPLRYPGAKSGLSNRIRELLEAAVATPGLPEISLFVEPFAGGASTSLRLLGEGVVERALLADADPLVAAFWQVAASDAENLVDRMVAEHAHFAKGGASAVARWDQWRRWSPRSNANKQTARFEAAVKCLVLNRTTFSGILHGSAGPIGGRAQASAYPIACRFNPDALADRLRYVKHLYDAGRIVDVWCKDWRTTLADVSEWYPQLLPNRVVAYLDPPYISKSPKLYQRSFDPRGGFAKQRSLEWSGLLMHERLADFLRTEIQFRWVLSYDAQPVLLSSPLLYNAKRMTPSAEARRDLGTKCWPLSKRVVSLSYSAAARTRPGEVRELLITTLPARSVPTTSGWDTSLQAVV